MGVPLRTPTGLASMPPEILLQVFSHLEMSDLACLLRLNRATRSLVLAIFRSSLQLNERTLCRCPLAAEPDSVSSYSSRGHSNELREQAIMHYSEQLTRLEIDLNHPRDELEHRRIQRLPFISVSEESNLLMRQQNFRHRLQTSVRLLSKSLTCCPTIFTTQGHIREPLCSLPISDTLTHVSFVARCEQAQLPWGPCNGQIRKAYLSQEDITCFLEAVARCHHIKELELDTADAEETEWTPTHGIGPCCARHVCQQLSNVIEKSHTLEKLYLRRRDVCSKIFDFATAYRDDHGNQWTTATTARSRLKHCVVNLRLTSTQRTASDVWEAHSRHCHCCCWCVSCIKSCAAQVKQHATNTENQTASSDVDEKRTLVTQLAEAGFATAQRLESLQTLKIFAYDEPDKPINNWTRAPCVLDCARRHKRRLHVGGNQRSDLVSRW